MESLGKIEKKKKKKRHWVIPLFKITFHWWTSGMVYAYNSDYS